MYPECFYYEVYSMPWKVWVGMEHGDRPTRPMFNNNVNSSRFQSTIRLDQVSKINCILHSDWLGNTPSEHDINVKFLKKWKIGVHIEKYFYFKAIHVHIISMHHMHKVCLLHISSFHVSASHFQIMKAMIRDDYL